MEEDFSEEQKKKHSENEFILRKSLLRGYTSKIAQDNIKLRENMRNIVKKFLRKEGNDDQKSSG